MLIVPVQGRQAFRVLQSFCLFLVWEFKDLGLGFEASECGLRVLDSSLEGVGIEPRVETLRPKP